MSRFVDPAETETVDLGPCECPGTPHERDEAVIRSRFAYPEILALSGGASFKDIAREHVRVAVKSWNLTDEAGKPVRLNADTYAALMPSTLGLIVDAITRNIEASAKPLPNESGVRSRAGSRTNASPTPTTPAKA